MKTPTNHQLRRARAERERSLSWRFLALIASLALVAAACSSGDDEDAGDSDSTAASSDGSDDATSEDTDDEAAGDSDDAMEDGDDAAASGEPIRIMATGVIAGGIVAAVAAGSGRVAVDEINAAGGVNGRMLELIVCNDELDPNLAAGCVQQALDEDVVAIVGSLSVFAGTQLPLTEGQIPWIGLSTDDGWDSPHWFNIAADGNTVFAAAGTLAVDDGCSNAAVFISQTGSEANILALSSGVEVAGGTVVSVQQGNGGDFAPLVEAAIADGAECVVSGVSPGETAPLLGAIAGRLPFYTLDGSLPAGLAAALGEGAEGVQLAAGFLPPGAGNDRVDGLAAQVTAIDPMLSLDQFFYTGYTGTYILAEVAAGLDEVTGPAVLEGLSGVSGFDTGVGPVIDFSTGLGLPGYSSIYNPNVYRLEIQGGAYALLSEDPLDMTAALQAIAGS